MLAQQVFHTQGQQLREAQPLPADRSRFRGETRPGAARAALPLASGAGRMEMGGGELSEPGPADQANRGTRQGFYFTGGEGGNSLYAQGPGLPKHLADGLGSRTGLKMGQFQVQVVEVARVQGLPGVRAAVHVQGFGPVTLQQRSQENAVAAGGPA